MNQRHADQVSRSGLDQSDMSDMDKFIQEECELEPTVPTATDGELTLKLQGLCTKPRQMIDTDVLQYWALQQFKEPLLCELSNIALCAAPTTVPVERAFSGLVHELTAFRSNMSGETVDNLMIIRLNKDLLANEF